MSTKVFNLQISEDHIAEARMIAEVAGGRFMTICEHNCPVARALINAGYQRVHVSRRCASAEGLTLIARTSALDAIIQWDSGVGLEPQTISFYSVEVSDHV